MGIYVQGAKMPHGCESCWIPEEYCGLKRNDTNDERHVDCPCVEIKTPHGMLVDIDDYRDEFMNGVYAACHDDANNNRANEIIDLYDVAPSVIAAEE